MSPVESGLEGGISPKPRRDTSAWEGKQVSGPTSSRALCAALWMHQRMYQALGRNTQDTLERREPGPCVTEAAAED